MDETARFRLIDIADRRAAPNQSVTDVMVMAESLAIWVDARRFPEEFIADCTAGHTPHANQSR